MLRKLRLFLSELSSLVRKAKTSSRSFGVLAKKVPRLCVQLGWMLPSYDFVNWSPEQFCGSVSAVTIEIRKTEHAASNGYARWRRNIADDHTGKELGKWLRSSESGMRLLVSDDSHVCSYAATPPDQLKVISEAWAGILALDANVVEARTEVLEECKRVLACVPCALPPLTVEDLYHEVQHKKCTAAGPDLVTVEMLRSLPREALAPILIVFNHAEETGYWPEPFTLARSVVLPKVAPEEPMQGLQVRLITITSHMYRLWSGLRMRQLSKWLAGYVHPGIFGGVQGKSAQLAAMVHALNWEIAEQQKLPCTQVHFDFSKCFDSLSPTSLCELLAHCGVPRGVVTAVRGWYAVHKRWNTSKGWYWPQSVRRGVCQGDPLAVLCCVLWGNALLVLLERHAPNLSKTLFMDDLSLSGSDMEEITIGVGCVKWFSEQWHVKLNEGKTQFVQNTHFPVQAQGVPAGSQCVLLGVDVGPGALPTRFLSRLWAAANRLDMLVHLLHLGAAHLQRFLPAFVLGLLHGVAFVSVNPLPPFEALERSVWEVLRGKSRYASTRGLAYSLACKGHALSPRAV
eukprot:1814310-Amphidinium_carterae.1